MEVGGSGARGGEESDTRGASQRRRIAVGRKVERRGEEEMPRGTRGAAEWTDEGRVRD